MNSKTIRLATDDDLPAVRQLLGIEAADGIDLTSRSTNAGHRYALVLDDDHERGGLAAAAVVVLADDEATLELLAVDPAYRESGLEERMLGVAEALCDAFGCDRLVVPVAA